MKEIKFRAWHKEGAYMMPVEEIDFEKKLINKSGAWRWFNEVVIMQYTGLKDQEGVEVYFNDIVEDEYGHRYEVVFEGDCLRCNGVSRIRGGHKPKNRWFGRDLKIIGNIYENSDLI